MIVSYEPLPAWANREPRRMEPRHAAELAHREGIRVELEEAPDLFRLSADSRVGVHVGDGWELRIRPRLDIPHLLFLLAYSARPEGWRDLVSSFGHRADLVDAMASGFSVHAERALEQGILRGYIHVEERRHVLRGRIRFGEQIARVPGLPIPIEVEYDDHTPNILENRMLLTASEVLLRLPRVAPDARRRLLHVRALLDEVEVLSVTRSLRAPPVTRLNARYASTLALAELILRARSTVLASGATASMTFLFDLNEVFESFLYARLREAFRRHGGDVRRVRVDYLDDERGLQVKPDITWWRGGRCRGVIDAKYKSLVDRATMPNADAYQMLAYCTALDLPRGFLIYAKDSGEGTRRHTIRRHGYEVLVRSVDVELEPPSLLAQVDAIADEVAASAAIARAA